jgi:hypothetical protein
MRAKVFVSCGQRLGEKPHIDKIKEILSKEGYNAYFAIEQRSIEALTNNVYRELSDSEYFLFIDFKRELVEGDTHVHRGSLFCHQELAIASFLKIETIGFQQKGVKREGILDAIQLNCFEFTNAAELPGLISNAIKSQKWNSRWKKLLSLNRDPLERGGKQDDLPYIYHVDVLNQHCRKAAINCVAYLHRVKRIRTGEHIPVQKFELKWAGTRIPYVTILPNERRSFDAFYITPEEPTKLKWKDFSHADTEKVCAIVEGAGNYELTYLVASFNFPLMEATFELELKETLTELSPFSLISTRIHANHEPY